MPEGINRRGLCRESWVVSQLSFRAFWTLCVHLNTVLAALQSLSPCCRVHSCDLPCLLCWDTGLESNIFELFLNSYFLPAAGLFLVFSADYWESPELWFCTIIIRKCHSCSTRLSLELPIPYTWMKPSLWNNIAAGDFQNMLISFSRLQKYEIIMIINKICKYFETGYWNSWYSQKISEIWSSPQLIAKHTWLLQQ